MIAEVIPNFSSYLPEKNGKYKRSKLLEALEDNGCNRPKSIPLSSNYDSNLSDRLDGWTSGLLQMVGDAY